MGKIKSTRKCHTATPETSILYRWAIDSGATHKEAVRKAKAGMAQMARLSRLTPEQELEKNIKWIREKEAKVFNLTQEQIDTRIECALERYEREIKIRAAKKDAKEKKKQKMLQQKAQ